MPAQRTTTKQDLSATGTSVAGMCAIVFRPQNGLSGPGDPLYVRGSIRSHFGNKCRLPPVVGAARFCRANKRPRVEIRSVKPTGRGPCVESVNAWDPRGAARGLVPDFPVCGMHGLLPPHSLFGVALAMLVVWPRYRLRGVARRPMRLPLLALVLFALGLGLGASAAAVVPLREDPELTEERRLRSEASRQAEVDEAQQARLEVENDELEAELEEMLELLEPSAVHQETPPEELWRSYEEAKRDARAVRRIVRALARWSDESFRQWPPAIRQHREWSLWVRDLLEEREPE